LHCGCASTPAGLNREQGIYRVSTNLVSGLQSIVSFVPAPVATSVEVLFGLASATIGAWNIYQQKSIRQFKNVNSNNNGKSIWISPPTAIGVFAQPASTPINY